MDTISQRVTSLLEKIAARDFVHARWLNTLSFMENLGTTKIYRSQSGLEIKKNVLQHAAEESRHALFFKKLIGKHFGDICPDYAVENQFCGKSAYVYFQRLDGMVDRYLKSCDKGNKGYLCYLYVTLLIEERASAVYEIYEKILKNNWTGISLKTVISEEEGHMTATIAELSSLDPEFEKTMKAFRQNENRFFAKLLHNFEKSILTAEGVCIS